VTTTPPSEETLFDADRRIADPARRAEYLSASSVGDEALMARAGRLLRVADRDPGYLEDRAAGLLGAGEPASDGPDRTVGPIKLVKSIGEGGMGRCTWPSRSTRSAGGSPSR
jgi:hypothetical protein